MTVKIKVPVLAESVAEANLLSWHKKVGDFVKLGDNLIDIETDKVTLEVAAPNEGVLIEILKQDGDSVESDEIIAIIDAEKKAPTEETTPMTATAEAAPQQQTLLESGSDATPRPATIKQPVFTTIEEAAPKLSPAVRNLLAENDLETSDIDIHKDPNRITKEDVLDHLADAISDNTSVKSTAESKTVAAKEPSKTGTAPPVKKMSAEQRPEERVAMTRLRKRAAERLLSAQHNNALLTTFNEVNMQAVMDLRQRYKKEFEETHESKLGFMSFFTKAAVEALKKFPVINASVDGEDIIYRGYFDIGIAVSSKRGLVVPVLRDADTLSFAGIESRITELAKKAGERKLTIEELTGGTFTLTNGGVFGSLLSTPIINPPQSAILGMHKIQERPVAEDGQVMIRPMMYLALSYDHRIIDGREAVQFMVSIKEQIEDPTRLLLQI